MCRSCAACSGPGEFSQHVGTENRRPGIPLIQMLPIEIAKTGSAHSDTHRIG